MANLPLVTYYVDKPNVSKIIGTNIGNAGLDRALKLVPSFLTTVNLPVNPPAIPSNPVMMI